jgi:hypothetical protein
MTLLLYHYLRWSGVWHAELFQYEVGCVTGDQRGAVGELAEAAVKVLALLLMLVLTGCAGTAHLGMSRQDFLRAHLFDAITLNRAQGNVVVYRNGTNGLFYYFANNRLVKIDPGVPLQTRYQYEILNR